MNANLNEYIPRQSGDTTIVVVPSSLKYVDQMAAVHQAAYGYTPETASSEDMTVEKYARHLEIFPEGQFLALEVETDIVVGVTTSMRIDFDLQQPCLRSWAEITSDGWLSTHNPNGQWLYGVDSVVNPAYQGRGVGGKLIEARYDIIRDLNLRGMIAGSLIIDYHKVAGQMSADQYVREVIAGARFDNNLTKQLKKGFQVHSLIPNYSNTWESGNWGVEIVWNNPEYMPARRPVRVVQPHRYTIPARSARLSTGLQPQVAR